MENKINIAELLKDCPRGMELDCLLCNSPIALEGVAVNESKYPIKAVCKDGFIHVLTKYGTLYNHDDAKCVIFPKGKTTWEGFQRPFKDGDIVATGNGLFIGIVKVKNNIQVNAYCATSALGSFSMNIAYRFERFATEEEKQKLFDAIKAHGYRWNAETKTLEKLIVPKFDITTLVPFESKVLARDYEDEKWYPELWGFYDINSSFPYKLIGCMYRHCIPYNDDTKHLLGKTDDCNEFYKTWK